MADTKKVEIFQTDSFQTVNAEETQAEMLNKFMVSVYLWMTIGLLVTALTGSAVMLNLSNIENMFHLKIAGNSGIWFGSFILQMMFVNTLEHHKVKASPWVGTILFMVYSAFTGVTFSLVVSSFNLESMASVFMITATMFAVLAGFGFFTKIELKSMGMFSMMAGFGFMVAMVLNLFIQHNVLYLVLNTLGIVMFSGITVSRVQALKEQAIAGFESDEKEHASAIRGALTLYMSFIGMFMSMLRMTGNRQR